MTERHVLVAGATGLVGRAAVEHFAKAGIRVTAVSRRRPFDLYGAGFVSVDLADRDACAGVFGAMTDVTHVVFAALHEEPELVAGWLHDAHIQRNGAMLRNLVDPIDAASPGLRNIAVLQGPKAYGVHVKPLRTAAREDRDEMKDLPNFYWAQEDYIRDKQQGRPWSWTVWRPGLVVGMAIGGAMNIIAAIGVYAAVLKARGEALHYPGGIVPIFEATDTELMARAFDWGGEAPEAANQIFNLTNGEVFDFRDLWPVIAESLGMEAGRERPMGMAEAMPQFAADWDRIRDKHGLRAPDMASFVGQSFQFADFCLAHGNDAVLTPAVMSSVKVRQAGFGEAMYTDAMFAKWFARYQRDGLLPPV